MTHFDQQQTLLRHSASPYQHRDKTIAALTWCVFSRATFSTSCLRSFFSTLFKADTPGDWEQEKGGTAKKKKSHIFVQ